MNIKVSSLRKALRDYVREGEKDNDSEVCHELLAYACEPAVRPIKDIDFDSFTLQDALNTIDEVAEASDMESDYEVYQTRLNEFLAVYDIEHLLKIAAPQGGETNDFI